MGQRIIGIITARGGSKRIPGKNIREFCGRPVIAYSIMAALESGCFDEVMVSTDSREIAGVAEQYGAQIPFYRSKEMGSDYATTADVVEEVLAEYSRYGQSFDVFCCIYPMAPFITAGKLQDAVQQFTNTKADSLTAVVPYSFPPQRAFIIRDGKVRYQYPGQAHRRSQDLEKVYHDCGQFYICRTEAFFKYHTLIMPETVPYLLPETEVQDIDTESDWTLAEIKYLNYKYREKAGTTDRMDISIMKKLVEELWGSDEGKIIRSGGNDIMADQEPAEQE